MKPLTRTQTFCAFVFIFGSWAMLSDVDYHERAYVEPIIEQAKQDELNKPRETLNRLQEDAGVLLALQEVR